jgi:hypothetical protein
MTRTCDGIPEASHPDVYLGNETTKEWLRALVGCMMSRTWHLGRTPRGASGAWPHHWQVHMPRKCYKASLIP